MASSSSNSRKKVRQRNFRSNWTPHGFELHDRFLPPGLRPNHRTNIRSEIVARPHRIPSVKNPWNSKTIPPTEGPSKPKPGTFGLTRTIAVGAIQKPAANSYGQERSISEDIHVERSEFVCPYHPTSHDKASIIAGSLVTKVTRGFRENPRVKRLEISSEPIGSSPPLHPPFIRKEDPELMQRK